MLNYTPHFQPMHNGYNSIVRNTSLVDKISDTLYDGFVNKNWKDITDDFVTTTKNDIKFIGYNLNKNKAYAGALIAAVGLSALANFTEAKNADVQGYSTKLIEVRSFIAEILTHATVSGLAFIGISKYDKKTWKETFSELKDVLYASLPISLVIYPFFRNNLADFLVIKDLLPEKATLYSQLLLTIPYYIAVIYSKDKILPKVKTYLNNKSYFKNNKKSVIKQNVIDVKKDVNSKKEVNTDNLEEIIDEES